MPYKTIVLGLIEQHPELHEHLRQSRTMLRTMDLLALELKAHHESWMGQLREARPNSDPSQIAAEALELAIDQLRDSLPCDSQTTEDGPTVGGAMAYLKLHTPTA